MAHSRPAAGEAAALARELTDFLAALSVPLHKHAIYPPGQPLLDGSGAVVPPATAQVA